MGVHVYFNPYYLIPVVIFILILLWRLFRYRKMKARQNALNPNTSNIFPPPTAASPAYPTESTGAGGFVQPGLMKPPSYETAVAMDQNSGFGFDTAKYGGGFPNQATSSGQDYDPIRR